MLRTAALLATLTALVLPAAASAASVKVDLDGHIVFTAADGEANDVRITREDIALPVGVWDTVTVTPGAGCFPFRAYVQCLAGSPIVALGDQDDTLRYNDDTTDSPIGVAQVDGGTGDDDIRTAMSGDTIDGGEGDDLADGFIGDDTIRGGAGEDELHGSFGNDTLEGGANDDTVVGGMDDDTLRGGDGNDRVRDNEGNDTVVGGAGADEVKVGDGDDVIDLRDGAGTDRLLECGLGQDTVDADTGDTVAADCETVRRPQVHQPPRDDVKPGGGSTPPGAASVPGVTAGPRDAASSGTPTGTRPGVSRDGEDKLAPKLSVRAKGRTLTLRANEAATVTIKVGQKKLTRRLKAGKALKVRVPGRVRSVRITARDAAGNVAKLSRRLR